MTALEFGLASGLVAAAGCADGTSSRDGDSARRIEAHEEMRIGSSTDPEVGFTRIGSVAVDQAGRIIVYEASDREIRIYAANGSLLNSLGGPGSGPGAFREVHSIGVVADTIWAIDSGLRRITLFDRNGRLLTANGWEDVEVALENGERQVLRPAAIGENRRLVSDVGIIWGDGVLRVGGDNDTIKVPRIAFELSGAVADTVGWRPLPARPSPSPPGMADVGGVRYAIYSPPIDRSLLLGTPDGWALIERPRPHDSEIALITITRYDHVGTVVFRREVSYEPREFGDSALNQTAALSARNPGGAPPRADGAGQVQEPSSEVVAAIRRQLDFPKYQAPVRQAWLADDGSIWLLREHLDGPHDRWLVVRSTGEIRGELELPRGSQPAWAAGEHLWSVEADSVGVPWLVRYRLAGR
jgi:hypothetical protein